MACTKRGNHELQQKAKQGLKDKTKPPLERLRLQCLSRGASGIKGIGRQFKIMDDDGSRSIDIKEFWKGVNDFGLVMEREEVQGIFDELDKDKSGSLDFDEFLRALRPPMSNGRKQLILQAFNTLDKTGDGVIKVDDLQGVYNVTKHKKYISGEWTEEQCLEEFLVSFDTPNEADGEVTKEEFMNYYSGVSASIDSDAYFNLMMTNAWNLNKPKKGTKMTF